MGAVGVQALASVLSTTTTTITSLHHLDLSFNLSNDDCAVGDEAMATLISSLSSSSPHLHYLNLSYCGLQGLSARALTRAIGGHAWPDLEVLMVGLNVELLKGDRGKELAMVMMEGGGGGGGVLPRLRELGVQNTGLDGEGARRVGEVLRQGACPSLTRLMVTKMGGVDWMHYFANRSRSVEVVE